jgi:hypothetical protein
MVVVWLICLIAVRVVGCVNLRFADLTEDIDDFDTDGYELLWLFHCHCSNWCS